MNILLSTALYYISNSVIGIKIGFIFREKDFFTAGISTYPLPEILLKFIDVSINS